LVVQSSKKTTPALLERWLAQRERGARGAGRRDSLAVHVMG
jgi:hypothetical protein